jgi:predicted nucleic acid-binding protein
MPYLIDSDWLIDCLQRKVEATALIDSLAPDRVYISIISYMEAFQGVLREADSQTAHTRLLDFVQAAPVLPFDSAVAEACARIREAVRGGRVRPNRRALDLMIAATAIENGLTLVTRNIDDFADIPDLVLHRP